MNIIGGVRAISNCSGWFVIHPLDGNTLLATSMTGQLLDAFCYIGVNCFVLISGWFQIKFSWKGLLKLYVICAFYGTLAYIFHLYNDGATVGRSLFTLFFPSLIAPGGLSMHILFST